MKELITLILLVGIPSVGSYYFGRRLGHAEGFSEGAELVLTTLEPKIRELVGEKIWEIAHNEGTDMLSDRPSHESH